jgi:hypothetical protein
VNVARGVKFVCICIFVCVYMCICVYVYMCICVYVYVCVCVRASGLFHFDLEYGCSYSTLTIIMVTFRIRTVYIYVV